jgi:hypothetical protein
MLSKTWLIITNQMIANQLSSVGRFPVFEGILKSRNDVLDFAKSHRSQTEYLKNLNSDLFQMRSDLSVAKSESKSIRFSNDVPSTPSAK